MTHTQIVAALRNDVETHCDVYSRRTQFVRDTNAEPIRGLDRVGSRVHASRPEETGSDGWGATPTTCVCGHSEGDHHGVRRGPLRPVLLGRCLVDECGCTGFAELRAVPGTGVRRHA